MNPIIRKLFEQVHAAIDDLNEGIVRQQEALQAQKKKNEEALQRHWSQSRELSLLRDLSTQTAALRERNAALMARHDQMRERLQYLLEQTRALTAESLP
jgi:hypothetical protein